MERAIAKFNLIIDAVEARCMAADGPVTPTLREMREDELRELWKAAQVIRKEATVFVAATDLLEALQMLRDFQNGPPLPSYEAGWTKAMALTDAALARALPKGSR